MAEIWDLDFIDWDKYSAKNIPTLISQLLHATNSNEISILSDKIEKLAFVYPDRILLEPAQPTIICLLSALQKTNNKQVKYSILEILTEISCCVSIENTILQQTCIKEICKGIPIYYHLLEEANHFEIKTCIGLLNICANFDKSIAQRTIKYFVKEKTIDAFKQHHDFIENSILDITLHLDS